jgi:hypothetical protein
VYGSTDSCSWNCLQQLSPHYLDMLSATSFRSVSLFETLEGQVGPTFFYSPFRYLVSQGRKQRKGRIQFRWTTMINHGEAEQPVPGAIQRSWEALSVP